jgi:FixJ family two-component response regulator
MRLRRLTIMTPVPLISILDDDDALRHSLEDLIRSIGFRTQGFSSAEAFLS